MLELAKLQPVTSGEEAEGDESRVVAAAQSADAECAGKSPPPARRALMELAGLEPATSWVR